MRKIALIGVTGKDWLTDPAKTKFVKKHTPSGYEILNMFARFGTHSVESHADEAYNAPFILEQIVHADEREVDAIVIDCACDPVLSAAREITSIPVIGIRQASLHLALTLGTRFSIITVQGQSLVRCMHEGVRREGLDSFCASVRFLDVPVLEIERNPAAVQEQFSSLVERAIKDDGADVVILGCTGLSHHLNLSEVSMRYKVPILDPYVVGIWTAVTLIETGLTHSKIAYPTPPRKSVTEIPSLSGRFDEVLRE